MPQYQISVPGQGTFRVDSPTELTDLQAWQAVQSQLAAGPSKERTVGEAAKDIAASVVSGAGSLVQLPGQLYGLATGNFADTGALGLGKDIRQYGEEMKSAGLKARESERAEKIKTAEQKGQWEAFKTAFGETVKDPALLTSFLAEQAPQLLVPFGAAKVAQVGTAAKAAAAAQGLTGTAAKEAVEAVTKEAAKRGTAAAVGAGAVQQGADVGAKAYEDIYKELVSKGATDADAAQGAINLARAAGASGTLISLLAQRLPGAKTLEETFAGVRGPGGRLVGAARGALGEGASEIVEETGGKFGANLAMREVKPEQSLLEGLGATAGMAAIGGVGMGGVSGALQRPGEKIEIINGKKFVDGKPVEEEAPPVAPLVSPEVEPEKPMITRVMNMASQQNGYGLLEQQKQRLLAEPQTEDIKKELTFIQEIQDRMNIETAQRLTPSGKSPFTITPDALTELGIKPIAPIIKRINGKAYDDPYVIEQLEKFAANKNVDPEVQQSVLAFVEQLRQPVEQPAAPVAPPPVSEAPPAPPVAPPVEPPAPPVTPPAPPAPPAPFTAPGGFVSSLTLSPAYEGIEPLSVEDADFELEALQNSAEKGRLTPEQFAGSEIGKRLDTAQIGFINEGLRADPVGTITALRDRLKEATAARAAPPVEPAPVVEAAAPAEKPTFEPKIVSRQPAPDGMEVHVFTTTDGYGTGLFDADAQQYVNGSITRFAGTDTFPKAENKAAELLSKATPATETPAEPLGTRKEAQAFGKAIGATQSYPGSLIGRVNQPAQKAAKEGNFQGVLSALEKSKNVIVSEIAKRAKSLGTKIVIDDNAEETYTGPSTLMRQMSIDGAKMHLEALNKIREFAPQVDALPDKAELSYAIRGATINAIDGGKSAGRMGLEDIAKMGHSMFAPLPIGEGKLRTKEDFKRLQKAYEDLTSEYGENDLQLTSTGSAQMTGVAGAYDADTDTIRVPEYNSRREDVLAHEIVHAQTVQAIANPSLRQKPIVARLNKLYEHVKKELEVRPGFSNSLRRAPYGIQSIQEFVAEGMGNPAFQFLLKKIKYENTSAWDSFVQTIANLIGVKRDTAFTELLSIYSDLTTEQKAAPKAEAPAVEAPAAPTPFMQRLQEYWGGTVTPAIRNYLDAFNSFGVDRLESSQIKPAGMSAREWVESFVSKQSTWDKGRKTGVTGIQALSTKNLWPTTDGSGERLRKAMLEAVKALKNASGSTSELMDQAFTEERKSLGGAQAQRSNFEQTLRTLLNKFGLKDVGLSIIEGMQDAGSYAQQLIRIADRADNPIRTLRHEAIHALRELGFFTDAQWKSLSKMAKDKWIDQYLKQRNVDGKPLKAGEESRYDAYMREYNGDMEKITEEAVADAFADFDASKPPAGLLQALLKRMKDLFQSIKSALTKVESVDQIFGKVEEGKLKPGEKAEAGERKSVRDRATANFLRWFGDSKVVDEKGEPLVVYHGTAIDLKDNAFNENLAKSEGGAFFFSHSPLMKNPATNANEYAAGRAGDSQQVMPVFLSMKNPLITGFTEPMPSDGAQIEGWLSRMGDFNRSIDDTKERYYQRAIREARANGNDGVIIRGVKDVPNDAGRRFTDETDVYIAFFPTQIKSAIGNNGDYSLTNPDIRKSIGGVSPGQKALETIRSMGMDVKPPEPETFKKIKKALTDAGENPAGTKESAKKALIKFGDWFETTVFNGDAAWSNTIHRSVIKDMKENEEVLGKLLEIRQSQTVNADNVVSRGLIEGTIEYDDETKKHQSVKKEENFAALHKKLEEIATKYDLTKEQMERIAHTYLVAKRLPGIIKRNEELDAEIKSEEATAKPDRKSIDKWKSLKVFVSPQQEAMVEPGLSLLKDIPELSQIPKMINEIRKNHITFMVDSGLWSAEYAQAMWDNIDWVPFYREEQLEADAGPQEVIRGLQVKSKEFQMKGSEAAVNDVFENMMLWSQYAMNRGIRADKARRMIDVAKDIDVGDRKMAVQVTEEKRGMNIVRIYRDGKQELWDVADPMFMDAFASIQNVSMPMFKWAAKMANILRNSVVLYPLFSVAQVPQDSFAAMYTSGLKPQYALRIPILAVKEFIKTLNKTSATHNELVKYGVVGARTFNAEVMRKDAEIFAGMKPPKGGWNKTKDFLEHIAMSADNAVRQAVYEAARQQGVSKAEALEKAFEIFNVRRRGTSKALNLAGQTIPFFYAYLAAQRVAYQTITGAGTSPTERKAALQTLAATSAAVFTLSLLYAMLVADDEDYADTPAPVRDRTLTIPGTGGVRIPLRPDFFLLPKIVAEHTYLMLTDQGYQDGAKFRRSMRDGLINAIASPTPLPQIAKPALEVAINYSFFDGKPVIGTFEKQKDLERQFNDSTSEFSKLLGKTGLVSPIAVDHLIRGMLGSAGGLALYGTNFVLHSDPDVPRPEMSWKEAAAALPGTSGFLKRPQESALKNDFYTLRDEVEKAVNTFNDIKTRSPQGMEDFLADEKKMARLMLGKPVDQISQRLSKIRRQITIITNMPENQMSAEDKAENIRQLREFEREYLKSVDVKALREMAKI